MLLSHTTPIVDSLVRSKSVLNHIYGAGSLLEGANSAVPLADGVSRGFVTDMVSYKVAVLVFVILYLFWIGRTLSNLTGTGFRVANPFAKITAVEGLVKSVKVGDLFLDWSLVVALCMLFVTRGVEILAPLHPQAAGLALHINNMGTGVWMVLAGAIFLIMLVWSTVTISVSCYFFRRETMIQGLFLIKNRLLKMSIIWLLPLVLLASMEQYNITISYLSGLVAVIFLALYLFRSCLLFMSQKISILHWFLYLCAVELLPITLLWAFFVR